MIKHRTYQVFGIKDNQVVHIDSVQRGLSCNCICPYCHADLIAKKGEKRVDHFAHVKDSDECGYGNETALHIISKEILMAAQYIMLPALHVSASFTDEYNRKHSASRTLDPYRLPIESIEAEVAMEGIVPDIVIRTAGKELSVEIAVTNHVGHEKRNWYKKKGKAAIQIDLSSYYQAIGRRNGIWNHEQLKEMVLDSIFNKQWIFNPRKSILYQEALAEVEAKAANMAAPIYPDPPRKSGSIDWSTQLIKPPKEGNCMICGKFALEDEWSLFDTATNLCKCSKCMR